MNKVPVFISVVQSASPPSPPPTQSVLANVTGPATFLTGYFTTPTGCSTSTAQTLTLAASAEATATSQKTDSISGWANDDSTWMLITN